MNRVLLAGVLMLWSGGAAATAECVGTDLIAALPQDQREQLGRAVADAPFNRGILWQARKDTMVMTLVGTFHFADPRHDSTMRRLSGPMQDAAALYVEAGPKEKARLKQALAEDPTLMVNPDGATLPERLSGAEWSLLSDAMALRGTPAIVTAKLRPWYVAMMLGISPCMMRQMAGNGAEGGGLDDRLIQSAQAVDLPVRALEPWDTIFALFRDLSPAQELDMIRASLPMAAHADDYAVTLANAYFRGDVWAIWEFSRQDAYRESGLDRQSVDEQMTLARTQLMDRRNQSWIAPLTRGAAEAAKSGKGIIAGFGALHLPGDQGVLRLLERDGWTIERLDG